MILVLGKYFVLKSFKRIFLSFYRKSDFNLKLPRNRFRLNKNKKINHPSTTIVWNASAYIPCSKNVPVPVKSNFCKPQQNSTIVRLPNVSYFEKDNFYRIRYCVNECRLKSEKKIRNIQTINVVPKRVLEFSIKS